MKPNKLIVSLLVSAGVFGASVSPSAIAGPNGPTVSNSEIVNKATASSVNVEGLQGSSSGGGGSGKLFGFIKVSGSGGSSTSGMAAQATNGTVSIEDKADVSGTKIVNDATMANINVKGASFANGGVRIGN